MNTFPESWAVLDFAEGSLTRAQLRSYGEGGALPAQHSREATPTEDEACGGSGHGT